MILIYSILVIISIIICIAALVITLAIAKAENNKAIKYKNAGNSVSSQLQRSNEYEKKSLKENLPLLAAIYGVTFLATLAIMLFILFG